MALQGQTKNLKQSEQDKPGKPNPQNTHCETMAADVPAREHADGQQVLPLFNEKREPQCRKDGRKDGANQ